MNIAIFADVHGRILLAFKLVGRFQQETGEKIDLILQCGDMGIFPDPTKLDKATIRHAESDETELGFSEHFVEPNDVEILCWHRRTADCCVFEAIMKTTRSWINWSAKPTKPRLRSIVTGESTS